MKKIIKIIPLLLLVLIVIIGSLAIFKAGKKQNFNNKLEANKIVKLPDFTFADLYDRSRNLSSADFHKNLSILNIFASWCTTCKAEHEILMQLSARGLVNIYGIAWRDVDDNVMRYLEKAAILI